MKNKLTKLIEKNGFLLFLFICVCLVAGGTIFIATRDVERSSKNLDNRDLVILEEKDKVDNKETDTDIVKGKKDVSELDEIPEVDQVSEVAQSLDEDDNEYTEVGEENKQVQDTSIDGILDEQVEEVSSDKLEFEEESIPYNLVYNLPTKGDLMTEYTNSSLIYSKTLDEWRGHLGVDIQAEIGSNISSPLDGTITEVYEDNLWGMIIVIDHGGGLESKFCNLGTLEMVKVGTNVKKGDIISKVGNSADIEMMMDSHIHLETRKNGKLVDPRSIND